MHVVLALAASLSTTLLPGGLAGPTTVAAATPSTISVEIIGRNPVVEGVTNVEVRAIVAPDPSQASSTGRVFFTQTTPAGQTGVSDVGFSPGGVAKTFITFPRAGTYRVIAAYTGNADLEPSGPTAPVELRVLQREFVGPPTLELDTPTAFATERIG